MKRQEFEHVIRAAADIVKDEIVVVGSQAVLAHHPDAPDELLMSHEVDLFPRNAPERSDQIDGAIGDGSLFHDTYDYYRSRCLPRSGHRTCWLGTAPR